MIVFHNPSVFFFLAAVAAVALYSKKRSRTPGLYFSAGELVSGFKDSWKLRLQRNLFFLRSLSLILIVSALARPQSPVADSRVQSEGIDIVLALDCSTSMLAEDFKVAGKRMNRLEVVKAVVGDFIKARRNDRIGIVAFAGRAYIVSPLTLDYGWLMQNLNRVSTGIMEDGTAIGSGIVSSLNRLKKTQAKSKVIILLTDGRNNAGAIAPLTAAEAAKALKVRIYTIGAGSEGMVPYPVQDVFGNTVYQPVQVDLDEDMLKKIASLTGAQYFRATDTQSLKDIYREIDQMEKSPIEQKGYQEYRELFPCFLIPALILVMAEIILTHTVVRGIP